MVRNICLVGVLVVALLSGCGQTANKKQKDVKEVPQGMLVVELLEVADKSINKEVVVKGAVTHVCQHSGKKCFIVDDTGEETIRIEAKGNIDSFDQELVGADIVVKGVLREYKLEKELIDEIEQNAIAEKEKEGESEHCASELASVQKMRDWMKENGKNYYAIYYVDGIEYKVLN